MEYGSVRDHVMLFEISCGLGGWVYGRIGEVWVGVQSSVYFAVTVFVLVLGWVLLISFL